jgi:hypothetical protein
MVARTNRGQSGWLLEESWYCSRRSSMTSAEMAANVEGRLDIVVANQTMQRPSWTNASVGPHKSQRTGLSDANH